MSDFDEWMIVELMGHRRVAGRVREVQVAGAGFLRLDMPATDGHGAQTQYLAPASVYAMHPTTEEIATAAAARFRPEPVSRWELEPRRAFVEGFQPAAPVPADDPSRVDPWGGDDEEEEEEDSAAIVDLNLRAMGSAGLRDPDGEGVAP